MAKTVNTPSAEEIAMLHAVVAAAVTEALTPLAAENAELRARLDKASACMSTIIAEIKAMKAAEPTTVLRPKAEPRTAEEKREFTRAARDLQADAEAAGSKQRFFDPELVRERMETLRTMERNRNAASE